MMNQKNDYSSVVPVLAHYRKCRGSIEKRTHIEEGKEKAKVLKAAKMDIATLRAIREIVNKEKENFRVEERVQERNEHNTNVWNNFKNSLQGRPKRRKIITREQAKKQNAESYKAAYINAINNLEEPLPMRFLQIWEKKIKIVETTVQINICNRKM